MLSNEQIESLLLDRGLSDLKWIDPKEIVVARWVRIKCMYGCNGYGMGCCPPNTPSVEECERFFSEYESGLMIRLNKFADRGDYPSDWSKDITEKLLETERQVFLSGYEKAFLLNHTCCTECDECPGSREDCRDKKRARPSPESFAVDVYQTARSAGIEINVVADNPAEITRIAILLIK
jgi:predicted metal-binding protein